VNYSIARRSGPTPLTKILRNCNWCRIPCWQWFLSRGETTASKRTIFYRVRDATNARDVTLIVATTTIITTIITATKHISLKS
jgi:drug/metabolite transporter (DMT)-like permease